MMKVAEMDESDFSSKKQLPLTTNKSALSVKPKSQISGKSREQAKTPKEVQEELPLPTQEMEKESEGEVEPIQVEVPKSDKP